MEAFLVIVFILVIGVFLANLAKSKKRVTKQPAPPTKRYEAPKPPPKRRQSFDIRDIEVNDDFRLALDLIEHKNQNLFITGRAGTGKSTLLQYFRATTQKSVVVLAPTGIAAVNVNGQTIHSFFRFPPRLIDSKNLRPSRNSALLRRLETLVIDEVSMVRADLMDGIDATLRLNRGRPNEPFGGVQVIMIGDLFQLPPIVKERELDDYFAQKYGGVSFFRAPVFATTRFPMIELQKVYRQTNPDFINLLNCIRDQQFDGGILEALNARVCKFDDLSNPEKYITLTPTNEAASQINTTCLERLSSSVHTFEAIVSGQFDPSSFPTDPSLSLKVGARVMMIRNDPNKRWVNGTLGVVRAVGPNKLHVAIDGVSYEIQRHTWENIRYVVNPQENRPEPKVIGTFQQYPLKLAWALTIHKSQGLTLDNIYLDLGAGAFAHGQTYVALSRCKSLEGIALGRPVFETDIIFDEAIYDYHDIFTSVGEVPARSDTLPLRSIEPKSERVSESEINAVNIHRAVAQAYSLKRRLRIHYTKPSSYGQHSQTTSREIDIYGVGEEYIDAFCSLRQEKRTFRLDRIISVVMLPSSYVVPKDYTPSTWVLHGEGTVDSDK